MSELVLYLIEANAFLVILYGSYLLLTSKLTFFSFNRFFLLAILGVSFTIPLLSFNPSASSEHIVQRPVSEVNELRVAYYQAWEEWTLESKSDDATVETTDAPNLQSANTGSRFLTFLMMGYLMGLVVALSRVIYTYARIYQLKRVHPKEVIDGVLVVKVPYPMAPFSFWNAVFVSEETLREGEFEQVLAHEKIHVQQRHSIDLLFVQPVAAFLWFNPVIWQLIKSLKTTHEYIVDKQMIGQGYSLVAYQTLLLRQLISNNSYGLVNYFNLSFIKKRITMMKIQKSGSVGKAKVFAAVVTVAIFSLLVMQCNSKMDAQEVSMMEPAENNKAEEEVSFPVLTEIGAYRVKVDLSDAMNLRIVNDVLTIDGKETDIEEVASVLEQSGVSGATVMVLTIDKDQKMGFVREVQDALRWSDTRRVLYRAVSSENEQVQLPIMLPPDPDKITGRKWPKVTDEFARSNGLKIMKVRVGEDLGVDYQQKVYSLLNTYASEGYKSYVVSVKFEDDDTFQDYLSGLFYVSMGFDQLYDERARSMFGKSFYDLDKSDPEGKKQYHAVRENTPKAISIAEKG